MLSKVKEFVSSEVGCGSIFPLIVIPAILFSSLMRMLGLVLLGKCVLLCCWIVIAVQLYDVLTGNKVAKFILREIGWKS